MDDAQTMRRVERGTYALLQYPDVREWKRARSKPRGQRRSINELHRQVRAAKIRVDGKYKIAHDRFMLERVQDRCLPTEEIEDVRIVRKLGTDHLDRDGVSGLDVEAPVHLPHAALSDQFLDLVNAVEANARSNAAACARLKYGPVLHDVDRSRPETPMPCLHGGRSRRRGSRAGAANLAPKRAEGNRISAAGWPYAASIRRQVLTSPKTQMTIVAIPFALRETGAALKAGTTRRHPPSRAEGDGLHLGVDADAYREAQLFP